MVQEEVLIQKNQAWSQERSIPWKTLAWVEMAAQVTVEETSPEVDNFLTSVDSLKKHKIDPYITPHIILYKLKT